MPAVSRLKQLWSKRVLRFDAIILAAIILTVLVVALLTGSAGVLSSFILNLLTDPVSLLVTSVALLLLIVGVHFMVRKAVAGYMISKMQDTADEPYLQAFQKNTRLHHSVFTTSPAGWSKRSRRSVDDVIEHASEFVESLNDQFTNPSGRARNS